MQLDRDFIDSLEVVLGKERLQRAIDGLQSEPSVAVRLNAGKSGGVTLPILEGSTPVPWSPLGHILKERPVFTLHPLFHSGVYYVQDSSAMFVGELARSVFPKLPRKDSLVRVLDLCAAPGGKTTDLADSLRQEFGDNFILVANEVMAKRATVLSDNVGRWGDPNVLVTSADPADFASMRGWFDLIVADVPCSGEGMFRKDEQALDDWSLDNVKLCASRQRRILADIWPALAENGILVYSTCTFNHQENDGNVAWMCAELGAEPIRSLSAPEGVISTEYGFSLVPGFVPGEGQYCAAVVKTSTQDESQMKNSAQKSVESFAESFFNVPVTVSQRGDMLVALPTRIAAHAAYLSSHVRTVLSGVAVGQMKGKDFIPDEDLCLCQAFKKNSFPSFGLDKPSALAFLHKDALSLPPELPKGLVLLLYKSVPLGFVKNLGNRSNNLHPLSRRIRMEI